MSTKRPSPKTKSGHVFGQARRPAKMFRAGLYARVSTNDQQTLAMQNRAMREYAARRGWTITLQVRPGVANGPLGPVGDGSTCHTATNGAPGHRVRFPDRGAGPDTPAGRVMAGRCG